MKNKLISIGQLIDHSWDIYRENFSAFLSISGWLLIVAILNVISLTFYPSVSTIADGVALTGWENFGITLFAVTTYIISPIITFWIFLAVVRATRLAKLNKTVSIKKAISETKTRFIPALIVAVLVSLVLIAANIIGFLPYGIFFLLGLFLKNSGIIIFSNILLILGMFVTAILVIRWTVYYILAPYSNVLDDVQKTQALKESKKLIKGRFFHVSLLIAVPKIVFVIFGALIMMALLYIVQVASVGMSGLNTDLYVRIISITDSVVPVIVLVLINPLVIISDVLLYKNLKGDEV